MSAPNASSSSQLVSYTQDIDYTRTEGFKQFKVRYNIKKARIAHNDPNGVYPSAELVYQAVKGPGCTLCSFDGLSLDDFISSGAVAACRRLKHLSLAPYYVAQMKCCTQTAVVVTLVNFSLINSTPGCFIRGGKLLRCDIHPGHW